MCARPRTDNHRPPGGRSGAPRGRTHQDRLAEWQMNWAGPLRPPRGCCRSCVAESPDDLPRPRWGASPPQNPSSIHLRQNRRLGAVLAPARRLQSVCARRAPSASLAIPSGRSLKSCSLRCSAGGGFPLSLAQSIRDLVRSRSARAGSSSSQRPPRWRARKRSATEWKWRLLSGCWNP